MEIKRDELEKEDVHSYKGTLFATIVFVGGGIVLFTALLFYFFLTRV